MEGEEDQRVAGGWAANLYALALAGGAESGTRVETDKAVYAMTVSPLSNSWIRYV